MARDLNPEPEVPDHDHFAPNHDAVACSVNSVCTLGCRGTHEYSRNSKFRTEIQKWIKEERIIRAFEHLTVPLAGSFNEDLSEIVAHGMGRDFQKVLILGPKIVRGYHANLLLVFQVMQIIVSNPKLAIKCTEEF